MNKFYSNIAFALIYAGFEIYILGKIGSSGDHNILGHFSIYHIYMFFLFVIASLPRVADVPLMILLEDCGYFTFQGLWPSPDSWVSWGLGGVNIGVFIPYTYLILLGLFFIFWKLNPPIWLGS